MLGDCRGKIVVITTHLINYGLSKESGVTYDQIDWIIPTLFHRNLFYEKKRKCLPTTHSSLEKINVVTFAGTGAFCFPYAAASVINYRFLLDNYIGPFYGVVLFDFPGNKLLHKIIESNKQIDRLDDGGSLPVIIHICTP